MRADARVVAALAMASVVALAGCAGKGGGQASGGGVVTSNPEYLKLGPDHGWSQTNVTVDSKALACQGTATNDTRGVTATSIKIGGLASLSAPGGAGFADADKGAIARFDRANAEGGIAGRKIDFVGVLDDGGDAGRNLSQAKVLAEQDQVFAADPVTTQEANYLDAFCKPVVPFFGWGTNSAFCGNAIGFGIAGCQTGANGVQRTVATGIPGEVATQLPAETKKTIAVVGMDNAAARSGNITVAQGFESAGFTTVYEKNPIPISGLTDPTPIVNDLMTADSGRPPASIFMVAQISDALKLVSALKASGYKGLIITPFYDPRLTGLKELDDTYAFMLWQPGISTDVAAIEQMTKDMNTYAPGVAISEPAMAGYWAADMLVNALEKVGRNLTVTNLLKVLNNNYVNYVPGALPETRWPLSHIAESPCGTLLHLKNGVWTAPAQSCGVIIKAP
jgi:ABC-type branched-subunit amino acid transport system substrate-binding protein